MRQFFKFLFASILGFFISIFFIFFIFLTVGTAISSKDKVKVEPNSVLKISLNYPILERSPESPFENFDFSTFKEGGSVGLNDIIKSIKAAKGDDNIKGIYMSLGSLQGGWASVEAIRDALRNFKSSGKFIVVHSAVLPQKSYYLATIADKIYLNPEGFMELKGFATNLAFFKQMLKKLEIEPQIFYAGKYKSATEPFRLDSMSAANREQMMAILDEFYFEFTNSVNDSRKIPMETIERIIENMEVREAKDAFKLGLVDGLYYKDQLLDDLRERLGLEKEDKIEAISLKKYSKSAKGKKMDTSVKDRIAVVYAQGGIVDGEGDETNIGGDKFAREIRKAREDKDVKALVLRVNSGGGSALASEIILREMQKAGEKMPVIVSMGDVAASGGYYIACDADTIVAETNTITGSIGVFGIVPNMQGFFNNKLGITFDAAKTNEYSDFGGVSRPMRPGEKAIIQGAIDTIYKVFKSRVSAGRGMSVEEVDKVAQGRVWTARQAMEHGLVDVLGGLDDALAIAAFKAGIEDYRIKAYPEKKSPLDQIMEGFGGASTQYLLKRELGEEYRYYEQMKRIREMKGAQARMPFELDIY